MTQLTELARSVDSKVRIHWDKKIAEGLILANEERNPERHAADMARFAEFEVQVIAALFRNEWRLLEPTRSRKLHYFGVGTGEAFERVVAIANASHYAVTAYDVSVVAVDKAEECFNKNRARQRNEAFWADIYVACQTKYIRPKEGTRIILTRVLDVLDSQEVDWERKPLEKRKTPETARRIGKLLSFAEVLLVHALPEENLDVLRGDSAPYTMEQICAYMEEGLGSEIETLYKEKVDCFGYRYTAVLIKRKPA
jgi:hypothetical protein